jgi:hypothetical protein
MRRRRRYHLITRFAPVVDIAALLLIGTAGGAALMWWPDHAAADVAVPVALIVLFVMFRWR